MEHDCGKAQTNNWGCVFDGEGKRKEKWVAGVGRKSWGNWKKNIKILPHGGGGVAEMKRQVNLTPNQRCMRFFVDGQTVYAGTAGQGDRGGREV